MNKPYYVILTGSKTNSGDHLIRAAGSKVLNSLRPDRNIVNLNGWEKFDDQKLEIVNKSKALILFGGPALRMDTYPNVYPLADDLNEIKVPILTLGIGYRHQNLGRNATFNFEFTAKTKMLLDKIEKSGYKSTVRCYNTLNSLLHNGYKNFIMGGCPAFYKEEFINKDFPTNYTISNVAFATGRMYLKNKMLFDQQADLILRLSKHFRNKNFVVAFHDPINLKTEATKNLVEILKKNNIDYKDISTTADNLISFYESQDLQIGYRVHAHIYMSSVNKKSVLIAEDSRAAGMKNTIAGLIFEAYNNKDFTILDRINKKIGDKNLLPIVLNNNLFDDIILNLNYEEQSNNLRFQNTRNLINQYFNIHSKFLKELP